MATNLANAQTLIAIEEIRDNTIVTKSQRLLQVLMVDGFNFSLKSEGEQNVIISGYQDFLNGIDFPIQIVIHSRKINVNNYLQTVGAGEDAPALLKNQTEEYKAFVREFVKDNPIMTKTFLVVVPFEAPSLPKGRTFLNIFPFAQDKKKAQLKAVAADEADFKRSLAQLEQRVNQVVGGLSAIGLEAVRLGDQALIELFYNLYNPETVEREDVAAPGKEAKE